MKAIRAVRFLLALCCVVAATAQAAPPARWTLIHLGDLAGGVGGANAQAVNDRGQVVGSATAHAAGGFGFALHAFLWEDGVMHDMGTPAGRTMSDAIDINDRGTALGGDGLGGQYLWRDGEWVRLSAPGIVDRINKFGDLAGSYSPVAGRTHAYLLKDGVVLEDAGTLGGAWSVALAMNDRGALAGTSVTAAGEMHAFKYQDGVITDLGTLGGTQSQATGINNRGVVVGWSYDATRVPFAFVHDGSGMRRLLPDLPSPQRATAINDHGDVVGDLGQNGSYLYKDGVVTRLEAIPEVQAAGWTSLVPTAINNRGWITGFGTLPGRSTQAFLLIPR